MINLFICGWIVHLIADWLLQSHWIAVNKVSLKHPAAWIHGGIHLVGLIFVYSPLYALLIAFIHVLIDTRVPLNYLNKYIPGPKPSEAVYTHVAIWRDQVLHIVVLFFVAVLQTGYKLC